MLLALPSDYDPNHPYMLVFGWHPWGGSAEQTANMSYFGLENVSRGEAILVAPEGQNYQDDGLGWENENGEDVAFLHAMLDRFGAELCSTSSVTACPEASPCSTAWPRSEELDSNQPFLVRSQPRGRAGRPVTSWSDTSPLRAGMIE